MGMSVTNIEVLDPDLEHSSFENLNLIYHYSLVPKGDPKKVPDVTKQCIRTVVPVKALKKTLDQFTVTNSRYIPITKNDKGNYVWTDNNDAVARIIYYEYNHIHDNNIKAIDIKVTAFSGAKELKKL